MKGPKTGKTGISGNGGQQPLQPRPGKKGTPKVPKGNGLYPTRAKAVGKRRKLGGGTKGSRGNCSS